MPHSDLQPELLLSLYRSMLRIRHFEEKLAEGVLAKEVRTPCHLYVGQEAVAAGICEGLTKEDRVFGTHRSHGHYLAKGGDMNALMAEIYGKKTGCSGGHGGSMHIIDTEVGFAGAQPLVAGTIPVAVGSALAAQIREEDSVTVVFFGDGAVEEGVFHEAMNFAGLRKLPLIFVCENNLYSSHLHIDERRAMNNIYETGKLFNMGAMRVDGNDVVALYEAGRRAVSEARSGQHSVIIEAMTYRLRGHVGAIDYLKDQDVTDIRDVNELGEWRDRDPIQRLKKEILEDEAATEEELHTLEEEVLAEVEAAHRFAQESPFPKAEEFAEFVYPAKN